MARKVKYYGMDIAPKKKKSNVKSDAEYRKLYVEYLKDPEYYYEYYVPQAQKYWRNNGPVVLPNRYNNIGTFIAGQSEPLPTFEERKRRLNGFLLLPIICKLFARKDSPYYNMVHEQEKKDWTRVLGN